MRAIITSLISLIAFVASAQEPVQWLATTHDFGAFTEDTEKISAEFKFINASGEEIAVTQAAATCGCTVANYSTEAIAPGDTATITVTYDPTGRPGRFNKQIYVRTTASPERYKLTVQGVVIGSPETIKGRYPVDMGPLKLKNGAVMMGRTINGHGKMAYVDGYNLSNDSITPQIIYKPQYVDVNFTPGTIPPGELVQFDIYYRGEDTGNYGIVNDSIVIVPSEAEKYVLPFVAIFEEDFSGYTPEQLANAPKAVLGDSRIDFGNLDPTKTKAVNATVTLTNQGKTPLIIRRLYTQDEGVSIKASATQIKPGKHVTITATYDPQSYPTDVINATAVLITNDPKNPSQQIRIVGTRR